MKKYRFSYPKSAIVIYALIVLASITAIVFAILRLAEVGNYVSVYPALDIVSIVLFVLFVALIGSNFFVSYYAFEEDAFLAKQLFSKKRVLRDTLCKFVCDEASHVAALFYIDPATPDVVSYVTVSIKWSLLDGFIKDLKEFAPSLTVETIPVKKEGEE